MWKKPARITDLLAKIFWESAVGSGLILYEIPVDDMPVRPTLMGWLSDIVTIARESPDKKVFAGHIEWFTCCCVEIVQQDPAAIHGLQAELYGIENKLAPHLGRGFATQADTMLTLLLSGIIMLLGSETKVLVGLQNDEFVWKKIRAIRPKETPRALTITPVVTHAVLPSVGPSDVWLVPDFREHDRRAKEVYENVTGYREECERLVGGAFLGRQYTIDLEGVYAKITGAKQGVTGLYLKVQPRQDGYANILARIQTGEGAFYLVVDEGKLLKGGTVGDLFTMCSTYFDYLVCKIYHDLVTVADVPITRLDNAGVPVDVPSLCAEDDGWSWIVAPRKAQGQVRSPLL